ncbi:MAG: TetR/AcrR family transcriptional regulator [Burkholderiales bacterium]
MIKSNDDRRKRRRQETGERLLDTAVRLFAKQGFAGTTVEDITESADVGKGTFFNYFPSKEHVFIALAERQIGKIAAAARAIDPDMPIRDQVRKVVHHIADGWLNSRRLFRTMVGTIATNETLAPVLEALLPQGRGHMLVLMKEGQRRGELRADLLAADLARTLQQFMMGTQLIWAMQPDADLHAWIDQALDVVWHGIAASPPAARVSGSGA